MSLFLTARLDFGKLFFDSARRHHVFPTPYFPLAPCCFFLCLFPVLPISFFPRIISSLSVVWCSCLLLNCSLLLFHTLLCSLISCFSCGLVSGMFPLRVVRFFLQTSGRLRCLQTIWQNAISIYLFSMRFRRCRWTLAEILLLPSALRYVDDSGISVGSCLHRLLFALLSRCVHLDS